MILYDFLDSLLIDLENTTRSLTLISYQSKDIIYPRNKQIKGIKLIILDPDDKTIFNSRDNNNVISDLEYFGKLDINNDLEIKDIKIDETNLLECCIKLKDEAYAMYNLFKL